MLVLEMECGTSSHLSSTMDHVIAMFHTHDNEILERLEAPDRGGLLDCGGRVGGGRGAVENLFGRTEEGWEKGERRVSERHGGGGRSS